VFFSAVILLLFGGVTDRLIPLFAVGAFLAFTLSQAGMVAHWKRTGGRHARKSMLVNGIGAVATAVTVVVVIVAKFAEGAWVTLLLIPGLISIMHGVRRHYDRIQREIASRAPLPTDHLFPPVVLVPFETWNRLTQKALRFALLLSPDVVAVHVDAEGEPRLLPQQWSKLVERPAHEAGLPVPRLEVVQSPYRHVIQPIYEYALKLERQYPDRQIAVLLPHLVERRWYYRFLHNQRSELLTALLLFKGNQRIVVMNVPWYLHVG
jgi:hypothetical protein